MPSPSLNPDPKTPIIDKILKRRKPFTYDEFNFKSFTDLRQSMEQFRAQCHGEGMEALWESIEKQYLPATIGELRVFAQYETDTDGNATPTRLFAESDKDGLLDHKEPLVAVKIHTAL